MLQNIKKRKEEQGFTIIEVLIVLAIAALILLIVFLAVPSLQRSSRNTGRKSDASRIAAAVSDFTGNNNGNLPVATNWTTGTKDCSALLNDAGTLGQLNDVTCGTSSGSATAKKFNVTSGAISLTDTLKANAVMLDEQAVCGTNGSTSGGSPRQAALLYKVETGSGAWTWTCIQAE